MHLHDVLGWTGPVTHRQYVAWQQFLRDDMNRPSRADHYVMQASQQFLLPHLKEGTSPPGIAAFKITFGDDPTDPASVDTDETDGPPIVTDAMILQVQKDTAVATRGGSGATQVERRWVNRRGEPIPPPPGS